MADLGSMFRSFTPATYGVWFTAGCVLIALIKAWPILALQAIEAKDRIRSEGRADLHDCKHRLDDMAKQVSGMAETVNNLKIELSGILAAYRVLEIDAESRDSNSIALRQARAILSAAFTIAPSTAGMSEPGEMQ